MTCRSVVGWTWGLKLMITTDVAMDSCLNISPLNIFLRSVARRCAHHLRSENLYLKENHPIVHCRIIQMLTVRSTCSLTIEYVIFFKPFRIAFLSHQEWFLKGRQILLVNWSSSQLIQSGRKGNSPMRDVFPKGQASFLPGLL